MVFLKFLDWSLLLQCEVLFGRGSFSLVSSWILHWVPWPPWGKSGAYLLPMRYKISFGGYLGTIAKLGPLARRASCIGVRGWWISWCPMWGCLPYHFYYCYNTPSHPNAQTPQTPLHSCFTDTIFSNYICLCSLTFSLRPDDAVSVWRLLKLVFEKLIDLLCFSTQEIL